MLKLLKAVEVVPLRVDGSAQEAKTFSIPLPALTSGTCFVASGGDVILGNFSRAVK
jgi:hypothetical protein